MELQLYQLVSKCICFHNVLEIKSDFWGMYGIGKLSIWGTHCKGASNTIKSAGFGCYKVQCEQKALFFNGYHYKLFLVGARFLQKFPDSRRAWSLLAAPCVFSPILYIKSVLDLVLLSASDALRIPAIECGVPGFQVPNGNILLAGHWVLFTWERFQLLSTFIVQFGALQSQLFVISPLWPF